MPGRVDKVLVCRQQSQIVSTTQLNEQGIDGADLNPRATTGVAHLGRSNVVLPVWRDEGQDLQALEDGLSRTRAAEALKQFL
jgi:hypothetical protein